MKHSYLIAFWSPFSLPNLHFYTDFFSVYFRKYGDIQCLDFRDHQDARTIRLLHQADLVVIGLPQNLKFWSSYFCYRQIHFCNVRYALLDYFPQGVPDVKTLGHLLRIPEHQLARLPYNARFEESLRWGKSMLHLQYANRELSYDKTIDFQRELTRSAKIFLKALENEKNPT